MTNNGKTRIYTAVVEYDAESKMYIASVPSLPPVHTQAATLDELQFRLREAIELCLKEAVTLPFDIRMADKRSLHAIMARMFIGY
jgi:predicted RNase H-like HicB family nuclease